MESGLYFRDIYYFAYIYIGVTILLTVTDEFGLFDLIMLLIDILLLALLLAARLGHRLKTTPPAEVIDVGGGPSRYAVESEHCEEKPPGMN